MRARAPRAVADLLATAVPQLRDRLLEFEIRRAWSAVVGTDVPTKLACTKSKKSVSSRTMSALALGSSL